ncbi:MAG: hypothetical protein LBK57_05800, partial [Clostridiales Family XIII bacterium]|nr:hypothetical protein [Clostridiales Family XIII bacterium]
SAAKPNRRKTSLTNSVGGKKMRKELEPDMETAEKLYKEVLKLIEEYTDFYDENGDDEDIEYKKSEAKLKEMTGKDISQYNLFEYWEEEGPEILSFKISLPEPKVIENITKEELTEIITTLKDRDFENIIGNDFVEEYKYYLDEYYHKLLKVNFKNYRYEYFNRQKGKDGKYFEYSAKEIMSKIVG